MCQDAESKVRKKEIKITINSKQNAKSAVTTSARFSDRREKSYACAQKERKREKTKLDGRTLKQELIHFGVYIHPSSYNRFLY